MIRYVAIGCLGLGLMASPLFGGPAASTVPGPPKIAVVDMQTVLTRSPAGVRADAAIKAKLAASQATLTKQQDAVKQAKTDLDKQAAVLRPDVLAQKQQDLNKQLEQVAQLYDTLQRSLEEEKAKIGQQLLQTARPIVERAAKQQGVSLVLDTAGVVYADPALDLTAQVAADMK